MKSLIILISIVFSMNASATIYYVRKPVNGGSDANDGSMNRPWANPGRCFRSDSPITAGDTCLVGSGIYKDTDYGTPGKIVTIFKSGAPGNHIIIKSEIPYGAKLAVPGSLDGQNTVFDVWGTYITIQDFDIDGSIVPANNGLSVSTTGIRLAGGGTYHILNNKIHHVARSQCSNAPYGNAGIYSESGRSFGGQISGNQLYSIGRLRNGELKSDGTPCKTIEYANDHGLYLEDTNGLSYDHNLCYDTNRGYCFQFYHGTHSNVTIAFNTFADKNNSLDHTDLPAAHIILTRTMSNITIANNIFYNPAYSGVDSQYVTATNIKVINNLSNMPRILLSPKSGVTESGSIINQDPLLIFANVGLRDYQLKDGSPAINRAAPLTGYGGCIGACDIGAYEFGSGTPATQPQPPQNLKAQ
jgi:hypothetical protein